MSAYNDAVTKNTAENNPEELTQLLDLELIQKRAQWQQATGRHKTIRSLSFFFLALVFLAGVAALFFLFMRAGERPQRPAQQTSVSAKP